MIVAIDLDNVIAETDPKIREIIRRISGIELSQDDIADFAYSNALESRGLETGNAKQVEEEALRIFHEWECTQIGVVSGADEALERLLGLGFSWVIVTSRPTSCEHQTRSWLRDAGFPYREVLFIHDKAQRASGWVCLVEDAAHHAKSVSERGVPVCLLDYPWNRSVALHPLIYRARNWREIIDIIRDLPRADQR